MRHTVMRHVVMIHVAMILMLVSSRPLVAANIPSVTYNHFDESHPFYQISIDPGYFYNVKVTDTCPDYFKVLSVGAMKGSEDQPEVKSENAGFRYAPPESIEDYIKDGSGIKCFIDPATGNSITIQVPHTNSDDGSVNYVKFADEHKDKFPNGIKAMRIVKGKTVLDVNTALSANFKNYQAKFNNLEKDATQSCNDNDTCKNLPQNEKAVKIQAIMDEYSAKYQSESKKAVNEIISNYTQIKNLSETQFTISTAQKKDWKIELAGAFTTSFLVDQKYGTVKDPAGNNVVIRQKDHEDAASLGLAAFVHVAFPGFSDKCKIFDYWAPVSFGLGVNNTSSVSYFLGSSVRFSDKAYLTVGYNWGPQKTLSSGISEGSVVTDPNTLNNSGTRTGGGMFIAVSYSFLGTSDSALKKPFADPSLK